MAAVSAAQAEETTLTDDMLNGRAWSSMPDTAKVIWVMGYREGVTLTAITMTDTLDKAKAMIGVLSPFKLTNGEVEQQLDRFYGDPLNMPIPIAEAALVVTRQARGDDPKEIDKLLRDFRRDASGLPEASPQADEVQPALRGGKGKTSL
jgi:hypothetical protein